ncbi:NADPH-dependent oxidoreductase 2-alkenal reductase [Linum perenne]
MASQEVQQNKQIELKEYTIGFPKKFLFSLTTISIPCKVSEDSNVVLFKNLFLSSDPYMRLHPHLLILAHLPSAP